MPYINVKARNELTGCGCCQVRGPETPGELNYQITCLLTDYILLKKLNYQTINDIMGALEGAKLEFYRRVAAPYEDTKIKENGDVY